MGTREFNKMRCIAHWLIISALCVISCKSPQTESVLKLWYDKPATYFEEALVLGNGKTGATVFGGIKSDQIYLNDATLWSGEPVSLDDNIEAYKYIPAIREALANEDYELAERLNRNIQGNFSQSYAPLGTMYLEFDHDSCQNYYRELDIRNAIAKVQYEREGIKYSREYFVSHPDKLMVIKLSASQPGALNFELKFNSLLKYIYSASDQQLKVDGYAPYHAEPNYRPHIPEQVKFDENRGTRFSSYFKVNNKGGNVVATDSTLQIVNANEAVVYVSIATSFNGFNNDPALDGLDNMSIAEEQLSTTDHKVYDELRNTHLEDYQKYFNRVQLDLGTKEIPNLPTDERLIKYSEGAQDKHLEVLYFQYGRYLLISSSRTYGVPANLQGIWNPYLQPPWSSNYTMNINVEENYWLAESANLSEMHTPFLDFIGNLAQTGKASAKAFYGVDKGWVACHNSDIWAMSNPVGAFGQGDPSWACWNMGGTWAVTHLWEHYLYTGDKTFLKEKAFPAMKGAAEFCLEWLVQDGQGNLVTSPSTSPENVYITPEGFKGATLYGATADLAMIRECFLQTIEASKILDIEGQFRHRLTSTLEKLYPYQIGQDGSLQEWYHDWEDADPKHRHQTHLFGLHPGHQISPEKTPELARACEKALEIKGDETTGWSKGWRINLWARLWNGNRAYKLYRELLSYVPPDGAKNINYGGGGGTYPNLLDAHPPFQIDGNFGGAAGVVEMLMQSDEHQIYLLPALPDAWSEGSVSGICARGGFEVTMHWVKGELKEVQVLSKLGNRCWLNYKEHDIKLETTAGETYTFNSDLVLMN